VKRINSIDVTDDIQQRTGQRDERAVERFVERFAGVLVEAGMPRMPSRAFIALLASEHGRLTAAELAERLQASPAAISGAVRYLVQVDLVRREREPGSRRDYYVVDEDVWFTMYERRIAAIAKWGTVLAGGLSAVGEATPAAARLNDMIAFFDFLRAETPKVMRRWHEQRN
jgi:DNA-binding transcriptional regulator GbsR (MarR family)